MTHSLGPSTAYAPITLRHLNYLDCIRIQCVPAGVKKNIMELEKSQSVYSAIATLIGLALFLFYVARSNCIFNLPDVTAPNKIYDIFLFQFTPFFSHQPCHTFYSSYAADTYALYPSPFR